MRHRRTRPPTIESAMARVRSDQDTRFAVLLAATSAFSLGFVMGFIIAQAADEPAGADPARGMAG